MEMVGYEGFGVAEIISILTASIGSIGLYGYVFSKRIFKRSFWLYFFSSIYNFQYCILFYY